LLTIVFLADSCEGTLRQRRINNLETQFPHRQSADARRNCESVKRYRRPAQA
jgi:hypothetical protein